MLVDTHIHLDAVEFDADRDALVTAALKAGVGRFIVPGVDRASFDRIESLAVRYGSVRYALGIHPLYVGEAEAGDLDLLAERLTDGRAIALGEIGLDFFVTDIDPDTQGFYYVEQLKLARRFGLPVILHVRRAIDAILKQLRRLEVPGGIAHAFNGSRQQADMFIAMGFKLGFGGSMTFSGSTRIRQLAAELPLEAIVLETDAPDIPPAWAANRRNEPANLRRFAIELAALRGISEREVEAVTSRNAESVLGKL
ncbi:TatD family hydrolase [Rhodocyclaceae bacterium SMB388]